MGEFDDLIPKQQEDEFADLVPSGSAAVAEGPQLKPIPERGVWDSVKLAAERVAPTLFSGQQTATGRPYGFVPNLLAPASKSVSKGLGMRLDDPGTVSGEQQRAGIQDSSPLVRAGMSFSDAAANTVDAVANPGGAAIGEAAGARGLLGLTVRGILAGQGAKGVYEAGKKVVENPTAENLGAAFMNIPANAAMALPLVAHPLSELSYGYDVARGITPRKPISASRPANNEIVLDAENQPVTQIVGEQSTSEPAVQGDPGVSRLSPGTPYMPGEFDDLVPAKAPINVKAEVPPVEETPINPGGAQADLPPVLQEQSKQNNSKEAFEALAKASGSKLPEPVATTPPEPKGNLMSEEAAGLRHDLLPLVDEPTRKVIAKYYTDTGDLAGALEQVKTARGQQVVEGKGADAKLVYKGPAVAERPEYPLSRVEGQLVDKKGRPVDANHNLIQGDAQNPAKTIGSGIRDALAKNEGAESGFVNLQPLKDLYDKLVNSVATTGPKKDFLVDKDAADTAADLASNQTGNGLRTMARGLFGGGYSSTPGGKKVRFTGTSDQALEATTAAVEANGDRNKLNDFIRQAQAAGDRHAEEVAKFALVNWDRLQPLVQRVNQIHEIQFQREIASGFNMDKREGYIQHVIDPNKLPGAANDRFGGGSGAGSRGFTKMRYNDTLFEHVEKGNSDAIKSWNAADLVENRLKQGLKAVNDVAVIEGMKNRVDPSTGRSIIKNMEKQVNPTTGTEHLVAPQGYEAWSPFAGRTFAVHEGYKNFLDSVSALSWVRKQEALGLPVGDWIMKTQGGIKHSMLLFDTFHAVRMFVKGASLGVTGRTSRALLEYGDNDLNQAVANKEITPKMADFARTNRGNFNRLVRNGLNIGQVSEGLDSEFWKNVPVAGDFNKWVFQKMTRSVMAEASLAEYNRQVKANPTMPRNQVARMVAKDMNVNFGNVGRQGLFKTKTMQDLTTLAFLAPRWFESMARTEAGAMGQTAKIPFTGKVGSLARGSGTLLAAMMAATQIGNLITKGQPTWKNKENDSALNKLDMWVPDVTGKTKGFRFSPLSMPFEITHDAIRYAAAGKDRDEVISQIIGNKLSPAARAALTYGIGQDYSGAKLRGNARVTEAAKQLIPLPLPLQSAINPNASTQRQLMASAGLKAEPISASKAEVAAGDKPLESMAMGERKALEKQIKANKPVQSLSDRRVMLERSAQAEATRNEDIHDALPKAQSSWVDSHGLQLPTYEDTLQMGSTRLSLTKKEKDFVKDRVAAEYSRVLSGLMENDLFEGMTRQQQQNRVNHLMTMARGRVRVALKQQMASQRILLSN